MQHAAAGRALTGRVRGIDDHMNRAGFDYPGPDAVPLAFVPVPEGSETVSTIARGEEQHLVSASACRVASTSLPGMTRN